MNHSSPPYYLACSASKVSERRTNLVLAARKGSQTFCWTIVSGTNLQLNHALPGVLCDYLVARVSPGGTLNVAIELKSNVQHANHICDQLQAGLELLATDPTIKPRTVRALLVYYGRLPVMELRALDARKLTFRGQRVELLKQHSGYELANLQ